MKFIFSLTSFLIFPIFLSCATPYPTSGLGPENAILLTSDSAVLVKQMPPRLQMRLYNIEKEHHEQLSDVVRQYLLYRNGMKDTSADISDNDVVSEKELLAFYEEKKAFIPYSYNAVKPEIKKLYIETKNKRSKEAKIEALVKKEGASLPFFPPVSPKFEIPVAGFPVIGSSISEASHTLVQFLDYSCPYCREAEVKIKTLIKEVKDLTLVAIDSPIHGEVSELFARGAFCANRFEKYQLFRDAMFSPDHEDAVTTFADMSKKLAVEDSKWKACLDSDESKTYLKNSMQLANDFGVQATPTFFLDGQLISGIDDVIAKLKNREVVLR